MALAASDFDLIAPGRDLDRLVRVVKLTGFVNSDSDFTEQPQVINGASDFLVEALGDADRYCRSALQVPCRIPGMPNER